MYTTFTLSSQRADADDFQFVPSDYLREEDGRSFGPATFAWSERQRADLATLFNAQDAEGARERVGRDLGALMAGLGWRPDERALSEADKRGEEVLITVSSEAPELYTLPWEILSIGAGSAFLGDHASVIVRQAWPGLPPREPSTVPEHPGVLFAWSDAGGRVPHAQMKAAIQAACAQGGVTFRELPRFDAAALQDQLDEAPASVVHILCHGVAAAKEGEPARMAWGDGSQPPVAATRIARLLRPYRDHIRLVVLSCCGSGDASQDVLFLGSIAQEIHRKGVQTVLCSRSVLSIPGAVAMVQELYRRLLHEGWSLERATRAARMRLFRPDELGETHESDAYGIELYTAASEQAPEGSGQGLRPVLSTYPFGTPGAPAPKAQPPRQTLTLVPADTREGRQAQREALLAALRALGEDEALDVYTDPDKVPGVVQSGASPLRQAGDGALEAAGPDEPPAVTEAQKSAEKARIEAEAAAAKAKAEAEEAARAAAAAQEAERQAREAAARQAAELEDAQRRAAELAERLAAEARAAGQAATEQAQAEARARAEREAAEQAEKERRAKEAEARIAAAAAAVLAATEKASAALAKVAAARRAYEERRLHELAMKRGQRGDDEGPIVLWVTVDAAQRLLAAHADGRLERKLGFKLLALQLHTPFFPTPPTAGPFGSGGFGAPPTPPPTPPPPAPPAPPPVAGGMGLAAKLGAGLGLAAAVTGGMYAAKLGPFEEPPAIVLRVDADGDGYEAGSDCADTDGAIYPGANEIVGNGKDDDCDPATRDNPDADGDGSAQDVDCDDGDGAVHPGAVEVPDNGKDDDCDRATPDAVSKPDRDQDGFSAEFDCDDGHPLIYPGADEITANAVDDDCDPATPDVVDADGDLWTSDGFRGAAGHGGGVTWTRDERSDCDDADPALNPGAAELTLNGQDDDCDPATEDNPDADADDVRLQDDCDDNDPQRFPGNTEVPGNEIDDDCDPATSDVPEAPPAQQADQGVDIDGDGADAEVDCDDRNPAVHPGAPESPGNGVDDDCDPATSDGTEVQARDGGVVQLSVEGVSFAVFRADGESCPAGYTWLTLAEANQFQQAVCAALGEWDIARIADNGSLAGPGYNCDVRDTDTRTMGHSLCKTR